MKESDKMIKCSDSDTCIQIKTTHDFHLQSIIESDSALKWNRNPVDEGFGLGGFT